MSQPVEIARTPDQVTDELTVYHDDDYVLAVMEGGPMDGTQLRLSVQRALTMSEGKAVLPPDLFFEGHAKGSGYRAWTIKDGKAYFRWYESSEARDAL